MSDIEARVKKIIEQLYVEEGQVTSEKRFVIDLKHLHRTRLSWPALWKTSLH
jgi:hypothetical protein